MQIALILPPKVVDVLVVGMPKVVIITGASYKLYRFSRRRSFMFPAPGAPKSNDLSTDVLHIALILPLRFVDVPVAGTPLVSTSSNCGRDVLQIELI